MLIEALNMSFQITSPGLICGPLEEYQITWMVAYLDASLPVLVSPI